MTVAPGHVEQPKSKVWQNLSAEEVLAQLGSTPNGLSAEEAAQRLAFIHLAFWLQES